MTSAEIRQSFLDFFREKKHTIVPSSSLLPDAPNLLFTNAGMNQFVPSFLGQQKPPWKPPRVVDTQKCIRAGGKHNDLEDVGLDTYHHTFFEMLGNWSFGDYFKKEAIEWAWELVVEKWKFPAKRLYATVYQPAPGDPAVFDQEAYDHWARLFTAAGLDPQVHIVHGGKQDNFWMMGDTGPCGPCSEIHVDLTSAGDTKGSLVNQGDARCIEIWNLVFIQLNANPDGTFLPLPAKHVDTGMGFERVTSIIQGTRGFTDFANAKISNYETDIFRPIFDELEKLSGKKYGSTLPQRGGSAGVAPAPVSVSLTGSSHTPATDAAMASSHASGFAPGEAAGRDAQQGDRDGRAPYSQEQIHIDIAFRVIADHIRTLSFAIADGIQPSNDGRGYVLRRILRRAVRYGRTLGFHEPFFYKLVEVLADTMGRVFPEIRVRKQRVQEVIRTEEEAFNKTLDEGCSIFETVVSEIKDNEQFLRLGAERLREIRQELDRLPDSFPMYRKRLKELWEKFMIDISHGGIVKTAEMIEKETLSQPMMARVRTKVELSHLLIELCQPVNELFEALQNTADSPHAFDGCRAGLRIALNTVERKLTVSGKFTVFPGALAFKLYDTYGFPLDLTELMARERGLTVDVEGFNKLMEAQRARARAAQKKEVISLSQIEAATSTKFIGYDALETPARVLEVLRVKDKTAVILDTSTCYAEMGGQVGDTGEMEHGSQIWRITDTLKSGNTWLHILESRITNHESQGGEPADVPGAGSEVTLTVDKPRRDAIQRHHTVTHLLHWALHEVVSRDAAQKGSYVGPEKLTFDFNSGPLTPQQLAEVEKLVNKRILENAGVSWTEVPYPEVKARKDVIQFFGEKYGETVRVVQIGGQVKH